MGQAAIKIQNLCKKENFGINDAIAEQNVTIYKNKSKTVYWCVLMKHFQNILSGTALLHSIVCDMILGIDKKTKRNDKLLGLIGVLSGTNMLHEGHR